MPLQNRVTPTGDIVATPHRGEMMGNRGGCFHRDDQTLMRRRWASRQWICCVLAFKARQRKLMQPGLYTELFFLDEATALAAGHRPCFECRRVDAVRYQQLWTETIGRGLMPKAAGMDLVLHEARLKPLAQRPTALVRDLPDGAFVQSQGRSCLVLAGRIRSWSFEGYSPTLSAPREAVTVLTPAPTLAILRAGYVASLHQTTVASGDTTT